MKPDASSVTLGMRFTCDPAFDRSPPSLLPLIPPRLDFEMQPRVTLDMQDIQHFYAILGG
jgi:hypothetical protein